MEFDSSFASLKEANLRVKYVIYFESNDYGEGVHAHEDEELKGGYRYTSHNSDYGGNWIVSVMPSEAFNILDGYTDQPEEYATIGSNFGRKYQVLVLPTEPPTKATFANSIQCPKPAHTNETKKLPFTVCSSSGYEYDGWYSYTGPPQKEFHSSYSTLEQANKRAEYVTITIHGVSLTTRCHSLQRTA